ncbi:hypothetical protein HNY73_021383 [Argiope bruennichi]|uniref:Uncharacterized protein n=1 Tax=Argiope bruennichi TaxID=94029 RepID=A0A8T0DY40_ARGBR|nr:hypothetical protein HNY73_021383 [Argiope bruennichi]
MADSYALRKQSDDPLMTVFKKNAKLQGELRKYLQLLNNVGIPKTSSDPKSHTRIKKEDAKTVCYMRRDERRLLIEWRNFLLYICLNFYDAACNKEFYEEVNNRIIVGYGIILLIRSDVDNRNNYKSNDGNELFNINVCESNDTAKNDALSDGSISIS